MANKKNETALVAQEQGFSKLANVDMAHMMAEELDGLDASFERIKIPSARSTVYEVPGEDPSESEAVKEFSAVILYHHPLMAYYKEKYTGGNNPPDCGSFDGITGEGDPGGNCKKCPYNPVSYTHLDVYKRQGRYRTVCEQVPPSAFRRTMPKSGHCPSFDEQPKGYFR